MLGLQALSVDKDVKRAESAVVAKYDLCDHHFETLTKLVNRAAPVSTCAFCAKLQDGLKGQRKAGTGTSGPPTAETFEVVQCSSGFNLGFVGFGGFSVS